MVNICGIEVDFPFEPYECQKTYMEKVITCLQTGQNGVLESPTGTGKTLCLLCATLAWRETMAAKLQFNHLQNQEKVEKSVFSENLNKKLGAASSEDGGAGAGGNALKIIYASRTHSQITQVVNELKTTRYNPQICVLGSREQMCINSEVQKEETNNGKVHMCRVKVATKACFYYNNLEISKSNLSPGIKDIEDIVSEGTEKKFCPYYMSREMGKNAELTFMPYNYILDFKARSAHSIDLSNSIIILDEGHNVESVCEDNMSFDFTSFDVASCIEDCQQCIELIMQKEDDGIADLGSEDFKCELTAEDAALMKALFLKLESAISDVELDSNGCATKSASFLLDELGKLNINSISRDQIVETIEQMSGLLAANKSKFFKAKHYALDKFSTIIRMIFSEDQDNRTIALNTKKFYKVHIQTEKEDAKKSKTLDVWAARSRATGSGEKPRTLSYWCFHPGLTMRNLMAQGVRSLIITSGTLSPLSSFKFELDIPFRVELENSHVIENHQVFVGILPQGPDGKILNSSYQHRSKPEYQISLGNTIINMSRIIPNGVLVFFPSYAVMDMIISKWQTCGIWERMATTKGLFVEPRRKGALNEIMQQYYEKLQDPALKGATFFAVCRGKVSEGLDFADANGRAVIITGLPFPPSQDPKVILKRQYLDEQKGTESISGQDWYRQQASRAVNQAIGRVIRHKSDYGAILLCDERFAYAQAKSHLPVWIKKQLREYRDFGSAQRDLVMFFRNIKQKMGITDEAVEAKRKLDAVYDSTSCELADVKAAKAVKMEKQTSASTVRTFSKPTMNSLASSSLAQLEKLSEKKGSLFDSLKEKENKSTCESSEGPYSAKLLGNNVEYSIPTNNAKSKKYKIVKKCSSSSVGGDDTKTCSTQPTDTRSFSLPQQKETSSSLKHNQFSEGSCNAKDDAKDAAKKEKLLKASKYIQTLKKALATEKYKKFSEALNLYKKSRNVNVLMLQFEEIFDLTQTQHVSFVRDFSVFVRENDKGCFTKLADKMCSTTSS